MMKKIFPLSFSKKTVKSLLLYLAVYLGTSLIRGVVNYFTDLDSIGGAIGLLGSVYAFAGLFVLALYHFGLISDKEN